MRMPALKPLAILLALSLSQAFAQTTPDQPIAIEAEDGIHWIRQDNMYLALGQASALYGPLQIRAEELQAHYTTAADGTQKIQAFNGIEDVRLIHGTVVASGDVGSYRPLEGFAVLTGDNLSVRDERATITARDSIEYWQERNLLVARGQAVLTYEQSSLEADILVAVLTRRQGQTVIHRLEASRGIVITTASEVIRAQEGIYTPDNERAIVCGHVRITRGQNQLNSPCASVDFKTGRSSLQSSGQQRVRALIDPADLETPTPQTQP